MDGLLEKIRSERIPQSPLTSKEALGSKDRSWFKVSLLIGIAGLLALLSGGLLRTGEFGYGMLAFVVWTTILTIQSLTLQKVKEILLASGVCTLGLMLPFWGAPFEYWGVTALIIFILLIAAHYRGKTGGENMIKIRFSHVTRPVVSLILMIGVIMGTFLFSVNGAAILTENNIKRMVDVMVTPIARGYIKDFSSNSKLEDVLKNIALEQINKNNDSENFSDYQKQFLANRSVKELSAVLREKTNFNIQEQATVGSNIHALISEKSSSLLDPNAPWKILILAAIILLLVKSIEIVLYIPLALLTFMLYELLIAFGFITVQWESRSKEVLNLI